MEFERSIGWCIVLYGFVGIVCGGFVGLSDGVFDVIVVIVSNFDKVVGFGRKMGVEVGLLGSMLDYVVYVSMEFGVDWVV